MRRLQLYLFALIFAVSCLFLLSLGLLNGSLREHRRRVDDGDGADGVAPPVVVSSVDGLTDEEALRRLNAHIAEQGRMIASLARRLDGMARSHALAGLARAESVARGASGGAAPADAVAVPAASHGEASAAMSPPTPPTPHAVVIFAYNRPAYLERALRSVLSRLPAEGGYTVAVSQDGDDPQVAAVVAREGNGKVLHLRHARAEVVLEPKQRRFLGYYCLAQHYGWALSELLGTRRFESVIILEDDIEVAPDFFDYFKAMAPLLEEDPTILTISAFSDNGQPQHVHDPAAVYRSDFFPGLGWLMTRKLWAELGPKWPHSFWDDWLREPANRKGRVSIRPEISRTYTYGVKGVSSGQFSNFLRSMQLAQGGVDWAATDVRWLQRDAYDRIFDAQLAAAAEVAPHALAARGADDCGDQRISYSSHKEFARIAKQLGLMPELKAGVPRTGYRGVVTFRRGACRVFLAPSYDIDPLTHSIVQQARASR
ncbi:hypothetical protein KFE25_002449 [Diacronema lutheri]|uniref:alpha-1,3-mannosyl-glycoprotein 2-beta-N-acetylglucosaminyltransferase n=2 Tax=Diacronema lutheri TaxID=2081491 RepID=A0A8J5XLR0_DIALT|nr:hypothetical protein KFE25_002449 [Diacronema lutheri]